MQPYYNYPSPLPPSITNPATSKALNKLKSGKLIQPQQMQYKGAQPFMSTPSFNFPRQSSNLRPQNYPNFINNQTPAPKFHIRREESNLSGYQSSQSSNFQQSDRILPNIYPQASFPQLPLESDKNGFQPLKPLSALQTASGENSRLRSSSASHFSFNENDRKITTLETKLSQYNQQILQSNMKLNQKQRKNVQLQSECASLKTKNLDLQQKLKLINNEYYVNAEVISEKEKKIKNLQTANADINDIRITLLQEIDKKQQKLQALQKMLKSKNLQIQSLNLSCVQLSKHLEEIALKNHQEVSKLVETIAAQDGTIKTNRQYCENVNQRMQTYENHLLERQEQIKEYIKIINQHVAKNEQLENENKKMWQDLNNNMESFEKINTKFKIQQSQKQTMKLQIQKIINDFNNTKKIGQQQVEFLQTKVEESALQKQRLLQEIELTKAIVLKRNMIFERKVIYDLKQQNDRLWAKLIQNSEQSVAEIEKDPQYWSKVYAFQRRSSTFNQEYVRQSRSQVINEKVKKQSSRQYEVPLFNPQRGQQLAIEERYRKFVEQLERDENMANSKINELSLKEAQHNRQDVQFYRNKCINLEKMVEEHLKINLTLKDQLQKMKRNSAISPSEAEIAILKNQLNQQVVLNQTLKRSFDLMKSEYEIRFKAAQNRVNQIENQSIGNQSRSRTVLKSQNQSTEELKDLLIKAQEQIRRLIDENIHLNERLSQIRRGILNQNTPISIYKDEAETQDLRRQITKLSNQCSILEAELLTKNQAYNRMRQDYEIQLNIKISQLQQLRANFEKVSIQFAQGKQKYDKIMRDVLRLEKELTVYKTNNLPSNNNKTIIYYITLLKSKLQQIDAFLKQIYEHDSKLKLSTNQAISKQIMQLLMNNERIINDCFSICTQIETISSY